MEWVMVGEDVAGVGDDERKSVGVSVDDDVGAVDEGTLTLEFPSKKEQRFAKFNQKSIKRLASTLLSGIQARDKVLQKGIPHLVVFSLWLFSADNGWVWLFLAHKRHSCYKPLNSSHPQS